MRFLDEDHVWYLDNESVKLLQLLQRFTKIHTITHIIIRKFDLNNYERIVCAQARIKTRSKRDYIESPGTKIIPSTKQCSQVVIRTFAKVHRRDQLLSLLNLSLHLHPSWIPPRQKNSTHPTPFIVLSWIYCSFFVPSLSLSFFFLFAFSFFNSRWPQRKVGEKDSLLLVPLARAHRYYTAPWIIPP